MTVPAFFDHQTSGLTSEGQQLRDFIEAQFAEAGPANDVAALNGLPGMIKHYYVNVHMMQSLTPAQWMRDFGHSYALSAWNLKEAVAAQHQREAEVDEAIEATTKLEKELEKLRETIAAQAEQIAALQEAGKKPASRKKTQTVQTTEADADEADEADEDTDEEA